MAAKQAQQQRRYRELILQAEEHLLVKRADQHTQLRMREQLLHQVNLLESVEQQDSLAGVMHRLVLHALAAQEAQAVQTAPAVHAEQKPTLQLEDLPLTMTAFDDSMLQRVAELNLEDSIRMFKSFIENTQGAVAHVRCHGHHSYMRQQLDDDVSRFTSLLMLHAFLHAPMAKRLFSLNLSTMQEEEVPRGWWARIAQLIPVHAEFAALVQAGVTCAQDTVSKELDSNGDVLQQLRQLTKLTEPFTNLVHLDCLLGQVDRCSNSVLLLRCMLSVYLLSGMLRCFEPALVCETLLACWPYAVRGMLVFEEYCLRDDVQAVLRRDEVQVIQQRDGALAVLELDDA